MLVVCNDDPRSWTLALRDFGADPERILTARARVVSKPGKLAALLAEHTPAWVILDNLRTWCRSMHLDTDNSSAAADAIDPIAEAIRECGYPVACTIVHNEARSKGEGAVIKGVTSNPYAARMRNSTVFEDAADWIVGCAHADGSTKTTIMAGEKTRREIPTETLIIDLDEDGHGTPSTGGGDDPFTVGEPVNPLDAKITGYLMRNPEGVSQNAVLKAVRGARVNSLVARPQGRRHARDGQALAAYHQRPFTATKTGDSRVPTWGGGESGIGGGGSGDSRQWESGRNQYGNRFPPYRGITSGNRFRESPTGTGSLGPCRYEKHPPTTPWGG